MNLILLYNIINILLFPFYIPLLFLRFLKGKETFGSIKSRLSIYNKFPKNKKLIWIHAASVGEANLAITIMNELEKKYKNFEFLITTGTLSSAEIINKLNKKSVYHEFTPIDNLIIVKRFYKYWRPTIGIFLESELWPSLVSGASGRCKLLLLNARLSNKSFNHWKKFLKLFSSITGFFSLIITQSEIDFDKYKALGCNKLLNLGNLKFSNKALPFDEKILENLNKIFKDTKIVVFSSTHLSDENIILDVISRLKKNNQLNFYPIIIPRHPERAREISFICKKLGLVDIIKSDKMILDTQDDIYIVDSFGELGLFYNLADIVFIGGSFDSGTGIGGHNLLEPAHFNNVIITGPNMSNFQNITDEMLENRACLLIKNGEELEDKIRFFLEEKNSKISEEYAENAKKYVKTKVKILDDYLNQIDKFFND